MGRNFCFIFLVVLGSLSISQAGTFLKLQTGTFDPAAPRMLSFSTSPSLAADYIVQFSRPIQKADRRALENQFPVFGYLPDDALVVRANSRQLRAFQKRHAAVRAVIPYASEFKVNSQLRQASVFNKSELVSIVVVLFRASENEKIVANILKLNPQVSLQGASTKRFVFRVPRSVIFSIAAITGVEHVAPVPEMKLYDFAQSESLDPLTALTGYEDGTRLMKFDSAWGRGYAGRAQILAMADIGVDSGDLENITPDLQGAIAQGQAFGVHSSSWADPMGHGTHVAGLLVGRGVSSKQLVRGGAYEARLIAGSMWSFEERTMTVPPVLATLFDSAYAAGARVHSNSWGTNQGLGAYDDSAAQVDEWMFAHPDMLIVFAAGNNGHDSDRDGRVDSTTLGAPGTAKNCLTVGASKNLVLQGGVQGAIGRSREGVSLWPVEPLFSSSMSENEKGLAAFSSRGPTQDGRIKPDVVAPGTNILGVKSHQSGASSLWGFFSRDYTWSGGTSMAAPLAASAVGIVRQVLIEKWGFENPSAALLKAAILHSAEDLFPGQFGPIGASRGQEILTPRPNSDEGSGRVNLENFMSWDASTHVFDNSVGLGQDQSISYQFEIHRISNFSANLVWTDAPGSVNSAQSLVNDLDMEVTFPDGHVLRSEDHVNNLESLELAGLKPGSYQLTIRGTRVPEGRNFAQPFALIYSVDPSTNVGK